MMNTRARTPEEYAGLVDQVIDELEDIREAASFDMEDIDGPPGYVDALLKEMRELRRSMSDGSYQFGRMDLPFMRIVKQYSENELPCIRMFYQINRTHREGLDVQGG